MDNEYRRSLQPKLIYVLQINDNRHLGCVKVGDATIPNGDPTQLSPNCKELKEAAKKRIAEYTATAAIDTRVLYAELLIYIKNGEVRTLRDYDIHNILRRSGVPQADFQLEKQGKEWYCCDAETVVNAIKAAKEGREALRSEEIHLTSLNGAVQSVEEKGDDIEFRAEQLQFIKKTTTRFSKGAKHMLWNAKMRFGKTLTALETIRQLDYQRVLIITHRPDVNDEWANEFKKIFKAPTNYQYGSRTLGESLQNLEQDTQKNPNKHYIYFDSIQFLRGDEQVGGVFDKDVPEFKIDWDLLIIDEAHEGTQTELGQNVINQLAKEKTHILHLSGTPFNLMDEFDEEDTCKWDYVDEQKAKQQWDIDHFGEANPYSDLPRLNIYTFDLNKILGGYEETADKAFNFKEFFRTENGKFIHEADVKRFLDLIVKYDPKSNYPYSTQEFRTIFRHSLWRIPGVKEAQALSAMLKAHPIFGKFTIVNVAGDGDIEDPYDKAKKAVLDAIGEYPDQTYTITLTCGKLTTGVTIKQWTACFMLAGSYQTDAKAYMQTIFRVQSPWTYQGQQKKECYVFDFAPDRTLMVVAETAKVTAKAGKTKDAEREQLRQFLNFCPVLGYNGTRMQPYDTNKLLETLKKVYVERAVKNGFDDTYIYNQNLLLKISNEDLEKFKDLKKRIGTTKAMPKTNRINIVENGLTEEQLEEKGRLEKKPKNERTPEEIERLRKLNEQSQQRKTLISILRGISVRIPLLIYGANISVDTNITMDLLPNIVDDESWNEFMPPQVDKSIYKQFTKYYDQDIIRAAAQRIRSIAKSADDLTPEERVERIATIFSFFRNPDKETILTPWRVVNLHLSSTIGGYDFFDAEHKETISDPRLVEHNGITQEIFDSENSKVLEINSKTGLYPLYVTYTMYRFACQRYRDRHMLSGDIPFQTKQQIWDTVLANNVFVICKTKMAKYITQRTLSGFRNVKINAHYYQNLINQITNKQSRFIQRITTTSFWNMKNNNDNKKLTFCAVVGNPPYQIVDGGGTGDSAKPIYNIFMLSAKALKPNYVSLIMPSRWMKGGKGLQEFRKTMMEDTSIRYLYDFEDYSSIFPGSHIDGGVCYLLWDKQYDGKVTYTFYDMKNEEHISERFLADACAETVIRDNRQLSIISAAKSENKFSVNTSAQKPYGLRADVFNKPERYPQLTYYDNPAVRRVKLYGVKGNKGGAKRIYKYIDIDKVPKNKEAIGKWKLFFSKAYTTTATVPPEIIVAQPNEICSETFIEIGPFESELTCRNCLRYIKTKFFRFLLLCNRHSLNISQSSFELIPNQDLTPSSDIDWAQSIMDIDKQLYRKYNLSPSEIDFIETTIKEMK